jgi:hypothetical protein
MYQPPSFTSLLAVLAIALAASPALAQEADRESPPAAATRPGQQGPTVEAASRDWEVRLEARGGYGGVFSLGASTGGVVAHGPGVSGAVALTWALSRNTRGGVRLGGMMGWDLTGESFYRDEAGAPSTTDAYGVQVAFQGEVRGRWLAFSFAPGLGILHLHTEEDPTLEHPKAASHDSTPPELTLSLGLALSLHRHLALTLCAEAGTLLVQTRGSVLGGVVARF